MLNRRERARRRIHFDISSHAPQHRMFLNRRIGIGRQIFENFAPRERTLQTTLRLGIDLRIERDNRTFEFWFALDFALDLLSQTARLAKIGRVFDNVVQTFYVGAL